MISQLSNDTYETTFRGRTYTLIHTQHGWEMWNCARGMRPSPPKPFDSLDDVESHYQHWRGIKALVELRQPVTEV